MQKKAARRGQRALAFLLCLLMVATLLPVMGASAAKGDVSATGVELNKTLMLETDGTYTINLEAYATGTVTTTEVTEPVPTDFVLVLDQSGSMAENITSYTYTEKTSQKYSYSSYGNQTLYYKDGDAYYQVQRRYYSTGFIFTTEHYYLYYQKDGTTYYLSGTGTTTTRPSKYTSSSDIIWTGTLYTRTKTSQTKLAALKTAVTNFVNSVKDQKDANGNPVDHRIAIVGFASGGDEDQYNQKPYENTELFVGSNTYTYGGTGISSQYVNALQKVSTPQGRTNLTNSIAELDSYGGTYPQYGFMMANEVLDQRTVKTYQKADKTTANRGTVVVMFTDGEPGTGGTVNTGVANATMQQAKTSKDTYNAKVFTIGVFSTETANIRTYMNAVSSNRQPTENETPTMANQGGTEKPASDPTNYYAMATDSEALNDAFQSVTSSVNNSSTTCELDAGSVLKDIISDNLDLPANFSVANNVTVSTATCNGKDEDGKLTWQAATPFKATVTTDGKAVNVSGFDYSQNYVTGEANKGNKLIVTITGLLPNQDGTALPSNETTSGIYDDSKLVAPFEVPTFNVGLKNRVVDFGMTVDIAANVLNTYKDTNEYGTFELNGLNGKDYTYKLKPVKGDNGNYTFGFTGVDSALYFANAQWTKVNVIPANNVYYDDDLLNCSSDFTDGNQGYDAAVNNATYGVEQVDDNTRREFTFTGTGIDVYCTTEGDSGWISAVLLNEDGTRAKDADGNNIKAIYMNNQYESTPSLINVPTISIQNVPYGKYVLCIDTMNSTNYELDGVRIYNPANTDAKNVADASDIDVNAQFVNVRDTLLSATPKELTQGAVYVDENHETTDISVYEKIGPKNEVYLDQNQKVGFQLTGVPEGAKVLVGLSAPENRGNATATVTSGAKATPVSVNSAIDMYYPVTVSSEGYVVIENTSNVLLSVTNVQITGGDGTSSAMLMSSPELMSYMADFDTLEVVQPEPEPTPDPEPAVSNNTVSAIIHAIWAQVKTSIDRLFGR